MIIRMYAKMITLKNLTDASPKMKTALFAMPKAVYPLFRTSMRLEKTEGISCFYCQTPSEVQAVKKAKFELISNIFVFVWGGISAEDILCKVNEAGLKGLRAVLT